MEKKFINLLKDVLEIENREISFSDHFREFEEWDSLARMSVIAMLDEEFDVIIEDAEFSQLITVGDLYNAIIKNEKWHS